MSTHNQPTTDPGDAPTPREVIAAANYLGDDIVSSFVGEGGLSGATLEQLSALVTFARRHA